MQQAHWLTGAKGPWTFHTLQTKGTTRQACRGPGTPHTLAHLGRQRENCQQITPHGLDALGRPGQPAGPTAGAVLQGCWSQPSRAASETMANVLGAMEATGDCGGGTQPRRGSPAKQRHPTNPVIAVRRSLDQHPLWWGILHMAGKPIQAAAQRRGGVALPINTGGDASSPRTPGPGGCNSAFASTCESGLTGACPGAVGGTDVPRVRLCRWGLGTCSPLCLLRLSCVRCPWPLSACLPARAHGVLCLRCVWPLAACSTLCAPGVFCVLCLWPLGACPPVRAPADLWL